MAYIATKPGESFLDQHALDVFDAHFVQSQRGLARGAKPQVAGSDLRTFGHQNGTLDGVVQLANISRPGMVEQHL